MIESNTNPTDPEVPALVELERQVISWPDRARALIVLDQKTMDEAAELLTAIKQLRAEIDSSCDPVREATHKAWKAAVRQQKDLHEPLATAESTLKESVATFVEAEERRAERERLAAEAAATEESDEDRLERAMALESQGRHEEAERVLEEPATPAPPPKPVAKTKGVSTRKTWVGEITDLGLVVRAISEGKAPTSLVQVNPAGVSAFARSMKAEARVPGLRVYEKTGVAVGGR